MSKIKARQLEQDRTCHPDAISDIMMTGDLCRWKYKCSVKHGISTFTGLIRRVEGEGQVVIKLTRLDLRNTDLTQLIENDFIKICSNVTSISGDTGVNALYYWCYRNDNA